MPLPTEEEFRVKYDVREVEQPDEECPICSEDVKHPSRLDCNCKFVYCYICIWKWLAEGGGKCPFCRQQFFRLPDGPVTCGDLWFSEESTWVQGLGPWPRTYYYDVVEFRDWIASSPLTEEYTMITDDLLLFADRGTFLADLIIDFLILELNMPIAVAYLDGRPVPSEDIIDEWRSLASATIDLVKALDGMVGPAGALEKYPEYSFPGFFLDAMRSMVESPGPAVKRFLAKSNEQILQEHADRRSSGEVLPWSSLPWNSEDFLARIPLAAAGLAVRVTLWQNAQEQIASGRLLGNGVAGQSDVQSSEGHGE